MIIDGKIIATCIYCNEGSTIENPMLFRINMAGTYWQHWNINTNQLCEANKERILPNGETQNEQGT